MQPDQILAKAPQFFKNIGEINSYTPTKITDLYGYQYLIKGDPVVIQGAIHTERFLEENPFGNFGGASIILSTQTRMQCGDLIEANGEFYAISHQKPYNDQMKEYDYICYSIYDYYKDFLIDDADQANQILGVNSMRYILAINSSVPILPSRFEIPQNMPKYIKVEVLNSYANAVTYQNTNNLLEQYKTDYVAFYGVNLDTNDLMQFSYLLQSQSELGITKAPNWYQDTRYNKEFDLKANIHKMEIEFNYNIVGTQAQPSPHLIKKVLINFLQ